MFSYSRAKTASSIQYGYRKCGTRAQVFSPIPEHENSKNEMRQRNKQRRVNKEISGQKNKKSPILEDSQALLLLGRLTTSDTSKKLAARAYLLLKSLLLEAVDKLRN